VFTVRYTVLWGAVSYAFNQIYSYDVLNVLWICAVRIDDSEILYVCTLCLYYMYCTYVCYLDDLSNTAKPSRIYGFRHEIRTANQVNKGRIDKALRRKALTLRKDARSAGSRTVSWQHLARCISGRRLPVGHSAAGMFLAIRYLSSATFISWPLPATHEVCPFTCRD